MRRFLQHVLPYRFVKLRHYGLLAPGNVNRRLLVARQRLTGATSPAPTSPPEAPALEDFRALLLRRTGIDLTRCPVCKGLLVSRALPPPPLKDSS